VEVADAVRTPVETSTGEQGESGLGGDFERKYTPPQRKAGANTGEAFSAVMESPVASTGNAQPITAARIANGEASVERAEQFQQVLERLDRAVLDAATESDHTMTITLLPRELGRLVLNCEEHQGQMTVELVAEDGQVCQTLREQETALRDMLQQSGYELSRFDVRDQRGGQQERGTFEQARDRTPRRRQAGRVEAEPATAGSSAPAGVGAAGQGVWYVA
jgi:flagellar hook-length control protein FliK